MGKCKEKVKSFILMETNMKVNQKIIEEMVMEHIFLTMEINMQANIKMIYIMVKEHIYFKMEINMKDPF